MAAGRHIEICRKSNNSRNVRPILIKFDTELQLETAQRPEVSKPSFFKIQDGRRRKTEIYWKLNNFETVHPICTKFGIYHLLRTRNIHFVPKSRNSKSKMTAGRYFEIYKNLNYSRTVRPILTKFGMNRSGHFYIIQQTLHDWWQYFVRVNNLSFY